MRVRLISAAGNPESYSGAIWASQYNGSVRVKGVDGCITLVIGTHQPYIEEANGENMTVVFRKDNVMRVIGGVERVSLLDRNICHLGGVSVQHRYTIASFSGAELVAVWETEQPPDFQHITGVPILSEMSHDVDAISLCPVVLPGPISLSSCTFTNMGLHLDPHMALAQIRHTQGVERAIPYQIVETDEVKILPVKPEPKPEIADPLPPRRLRFSPTED